MRNKRNVKRGEEGDGEDPMAHFSNSGAFWKNVSEYVAPFTQHDLDFCKTNGVGFVGECTDLIFRKDFHQIMN